MPRVRAIVARAGHPASMQRSCPIGPLLGAAPLALALTLNTCLAHHLGLLALKVGRAVDEVADHGVVVERLEELLRLGVVADLGELWGLAMRDLNMV